MSLKHNLLAPLAQSLHLKILRAIANTRTIPTLETAAGDVGLIWLLIIETGANANTTFQLAVKHGHTDVVRMVLELPLEHGVNPAEHDNEALLNACHNGHTEIVRLLLDLPLERGGGSRECASNRKRTWAHGNCSFAP